MDSKLRSELAQPGPLSFDTREWLVCSVIPILALAQHRITEAEIQRLEAIVAALAEFPPTVRPSEPRLQFWQAIAEATRNPLVVANVRSWADAMRERAQHPSLPPTGPERVNPETVYRGLILALKNGTGAPEYWSKVIARVSD